MPTQKKGCDDDEIVGLFSPQRRLFRKSKAAVLFRAKVSYRLMYILHESAMTPTHSSLGTLSWLVIILCMVLSHPTSLTENYVHTRIDENYWQQSSVYHPPGLSY